MTTKPTPKNIWSFRQNHPELVVRDLEEDLGLDNNQQQLVRDSLLRRGVNKWLKVRRDLIAYKKQIKHEISDLEQLKQKEKNYVKKREMVARQKALIEVRKNLKKLCMTERYVEFPRRVSDLYKVNSIKASDKK